MSRHVGERDRECPFIIRNSWAVFKVGALWRVLRPSRGWACHEIDSWAGDFADHATALTFATDAKVREVVLSRPCAPFVQGADRIAWIEGYAAECVAHQPVAVMLFGPVRDAA